MSSYNWNFVIHALRDTFKKPSVPAVISNDGKAMRNFRSPEHSWGFYQYHSEALSVPKLEGVENYYIQWNQTDTRSKEIVHDFVLIDTIIDKRSLFDNLKKIIQVRAFVVLLGDPMVEDVPLALNESKTKELEAFRSVFEHGKVKVYENL